METRLAGQIIPKGTKENNNNHGTSDRSCEWQFKKRREKKRSQMGKRAKPIRELRYILASSHSANAGVGKDTVNIATELRGIRRDPFVRARALGQ